MDLEKVMLSQEVFIPVYFATWTPEFQDILDDVANSMVTDEKAGTAAQGLFLVIWMKINDMNKKFTYHFLWKQIYNNITSLILKIVYGQISYLGHRVKLATAYG